MAGPSPQVPGWRGLRHLRASTARREGRGEGASRPGGGGPRAWLRPQVRRRPRAAGVRGRGPGRGPGCAPALRAPQRFPPRPGAGYRAEDRLRGDPDSQLSDRVPRPEGLGRSLEKAGCMQGSERDSAGLPGLLSQTVFTLLTFEAREMSRGGKLGMLFKCL